MDKTNRVATMTVLSPDEKFLVVGTTFDQPANANPDGSPILWAEKNGTPHSIASNAPDPDGTVTAGPITQIDTSGGLPTELCWVAVSPDDIPQVQLEAVFEDGSRLVTVHSPIQ